jgi:hypothetical protein
MEFKYRGARAMVMLHDHHMHEFLLTWREFKTTGLSFPQTEDTDYVSPETLLVHVFRAARGYMTWMCNSLGLPDPQIKPTPGSDEIEAQATSYLHHVLEQWQKPLVDVEEDRFGEVYKARWGVDYCIDSMLEHAVMHPIRHTFQLKELMAKW